jgi:SAM-dependent methyltransferase
MGPIRNPRWEQKRTEGYVIVSRLNHAIGMGYQINQNIILTGNLNQLFSECHRVLKNDGLILFSTFGPDTLKELKKSWAVVDNQTHVNSFIDMHAS